MHQYSGSPGFVHGLATPAVSLAPYHESTPIRRGYSGEKYLSAVTECSDCKRKKKKLNGLLIVNLLVFERGARP